MLTLAGVVGGAYASWTHSQDNGIYLDSRVTALEGAAKSAADNRQRDRDLLVSIKTNVEWLMYRAGGTSPVGQRGDAPDTLKP